MQYIKLKSIIGAREVAHCERKREEERKGEREEGRKKGRKEGNFSYSRNITENKEKCFIMKIFNLKEI
jgi:hypothetical protein